MNGDKRLIANPLEGMGKLDAKADPRRKARAGHVYHRYYYRRERLPQLRSICVILGQFLTL
jgi:hypothetical protein